jgi:hypothetical protein
MDQPEHRLRVWLKPGAPAPHEHLLVQLNRGGYARDGDPLLKSRQPGLHAWLLQCANSRHVRGPTSHRAARARLVPG